MSEFKTFALKGNVVDLAVGVIIGAGFQKIVSSLVSDIIMPPISRLLGDKGFIDKFISLDGKTYTSLAKAKELGAPVFAYGNFIQTILDFVILAFIIFMMVKAINSLKRKEEEKPVPTEPTTTEKLLMEIRDSLKK